MWKWRLLTYEEASWTALLRFRYGYFPSLLMGGVPGTNRKKESIWWKDITGNGRGLAEDWFRSNVGCRWEKNRVMDIQMVWESTV
jgi:hypothetical protein